MDFIINFTVVILVATGVFMYMMIIQKRKQKIRDKHFNMLMESLARKARVEHESNIKDAK